MTTLIDESLFGYLNQCGDQMRILNLGSGVGLFDGKIRPGLTTVNLDVYANDRTQVMADGHYLPFRDESLDGVVSIAVLEHVQRPWVVAQEIWRVLKPGGRVFVDVPFLNPIHDTHDYFRFTDRGLEVLFSRFEKIAGGVSSGPGSFVGPFVVAYLWAVTPGSFWRAVEEWTCSVMLWPVKYLDYLVRNRTDLRLIADGFYFVGMKPLCNPA